MSRKTAATGECRTRCGGGVEVEGLLSYREFETWTMWVEAGLREQATELKNAWEELAVRLRRVEIRKDQW